MMMQFSLVYKQQVKNSSHRSSSILPFMKKSGFLLLLSLEALSSPSPPLSKSVCKMSGNYFVIHHFAVQAI